MSKTLKIEGDAVIYQARGSSEGVVKFTRLVELLGLLPDNLSHSVVKQNPEVRKHTLAEQEAIYAYYSSWYVLASAAEAGKTWPELQSDLVKIAEAAKAEREKRNTQANASSASTFPYQET